ncbi:MAG: 50S ribosomal protein L10 [Phycisphaerae bacterium]|nr:50S ribosomal protein L10 [Phycisphaerae bacterium]
MRDLRHDDTGGGGGSRMSRPVKQMIVKEYQKRFEGVDNALLVDIRGIPANDNNALRLGLLKKDIRVTVIRNTLAKDAFEGTGLEGLEAGLEGPSALCYGGSSVVDVARELVDWAKKLDDLDLKGAILDGQYFDGENGVKELSKFPTREEAQAKVVQLVLTPGSNLVGAAVGPGRKLLAIVKEIQDRLEDGKTIEKVG